jgi:hypothetical protein
MSEYPKIKLFKNDEPGYYKVIIRPEKNRKVVMYKYPARKDFLIEFIVLIGHRNINVSRVVIADDSLALICRSLIYISKSEQGLDGSK